VIFHVTVARRYGLQGAGVARRAEGGDDYHEVDVPKAGAAIRSGGFWAGVYMIVALGEFPELLMVFSKMCLCHRDYFREQPEGRTVHQSLRRLPGKRYVPSRSGKPLSCPLGGCIAPLLALGKHLDYLTERGLKARSN
jgi:hypothetical protein